MRYRQLGTHEIVVSEVGLGGNTFGPPRLDLAASVACIHRAEELGVNFIDTAVIYGEGHSERFIAEAIASRRDKWVIATKFNFSRMRPEETPAQRVRSQCEESLRKLRTDRIDLYQMHAPADVEMEEVFEELDRLVTAGKVRVTGVCNFASWRHADLLARGESRGWPRLATSQNHYNVLHRHVELETLPFCRHNGIGFLPYHPLAGGFLTDKYEKDRPAPAGTRGASGSPIVKRSRTVRNEEIQDRLKALARARGRTLVDLAFAWLLSKPEVSCVIAGVSTPAQVDANVRAANWVLTADDLREIDEIAGWDGTGEAIEMLLP